MGGNSEAGSRGSHIDLLKCTTKVWKHLEEVFFSVLFNTSVGRRTSWSAELIM